MICSEHMATLELSNSSGTLLPKSYSGVSLAAAAAAAGSMQRTRGMGRGQQPDLPQDNASGGGGGGGGSGRSTTTSAGSAPGRGAGGRNNSKLKVLVRSHAMREETSPPREPTPTPCINLIPSPSASPEHPATPTPLYNHTTSPVLHSPTSPRVTLSPRCSPTTIVIGSSRSQTVQATPTATASPNHSSAAAAAAAASAPPTVDSNYSTSSSSSSGSGSGMVVRCKQRHQQQQQQQQQPLDDSSEATVLGVESSSGTVSCPADKATVRTQDILSSAIVRKINGSSFAQIAVELNAAANEEDVLDEFEVDVREDDDIDDDDDEEEEEEADEDGGIYCKSAGKCENNNASVLNKTSDSSLLLTSNQKLKQSMMNNNNNNSFNHSNNTRQQQQQSDTQQQQQQQQQQQLYICDCFKQNCTKCGKNNYERNINNNNINSSGNHNNNNMMSGSGVTTQHQQQHQQQQQHSNNTLTVSRASVKHKLRHQSSSQGSFDGSSSTSPCLSRDNSTEQYTDTTGIDLTQFILETLNKNAKDRVMMLKIEQELVNLAKDKVKTHYKFPPMSSYQRMLVHRCAAYFGMDHNIEISGKCVVVNKTKNTRIPELRFRDHIREDLLFPEEPRRSILKRDSNSFEDCNYKSPDRQFDNRRSKSFEEREEEYEKARRRIFKDGTMQDCNSQEDFNWAEMPWPESECSKIRLLPPEQQINVKQNRLLKVQSVDGKAETTLRPCVAKSFSFGGYGGAVSVLTRGDSVTSTHSAGPRLLTKQDSSTSTISWRLSPSSSGYKSQSQRSDSVTPSPTATPHQLSESSEETVEQAQQTDKELESPQAEDVTAPGGSGGTGGDGGNSLVWAVTDMQSVPKGSVLINPQTGQPFTNQDGSIYHFDPSHPPPGFTPTAAAKQPPSPSPVPPSPPRTITPQQCSPVKADRSPSPKKPAKSKASPFKNKQQCLINSSTSPSLPMTPPAQNQSHSSGGSISYTTSTPLDTAQMPPLQSYPVYPNGYGGPATEPMYQQPLGMMYTPYGMPPPYENRPDASVAELSGYFVNMALSEPPQCGTQTVGYQTPSGTYWNQQPTITYYQPPPPPVNQPQQPQRYPVQLPMPNQTQSTFVSSNYAPNYVPVPPPNPAPVPPNTDLLPVYPNTGMQMVYPSQQNAGPNPVYIQNPNPMMYGAQNPSAAAAAAVYSQGTVYPNLAYPPSSATPNGAPTNATYSTPSYAQTQPNQCFAQNVPSFVHNMSAGGFEPPPPHRPMNMHRNTTPKSKCTGAKQLSFCPLPQVPLPTHQSSNQSSNGSNSPANTVITGYFPNTGGPVNFRQCTPPETPPNQQQNLGYGYPSNYVQHSVIFRPLGGIRASPPVNMRSSRSPTPAPEYPQVGSVDRNQRYPVGPTVYHSMPCIVPGDMRLVTGRTQPPVYRQPYRQQSSCQSTLDHSNSAGRSHKVRKPRTKVPALPTSGRQSNQSVHAHTQQPRF